MNYVELYTCPGDAYGKGLSLRQKLEKLVQKFPGNSFYKRLLSSRRPLSKRATQRVDLDFCVNDVNG